MLQEDDGLENRLGKAEENLEGIVQPSSRRILRGIWDYVSDKRRLTSIAVLGGTIAGTAFLGDKSNDIGDYFRTLVPWLSDKTISLIWDSAINAVIAPIGFLLSNYANENRLNKKEFAGQVAFAAMWGAIRHYAYSGLSHFDGINAADMSSKLGLFTAYSAFYAGFYASFSEYLSKVCQGVSHLKALKGVFKNFREKPVALVKDPDVQLGYSLTAANMFNPWMESRPTIGAALLLIYNMGVIKHSHGRRRGFLDYVKQTFYK